MKTCIMFLLAAGVTALVHGTQPRDDPVVAALLKLNGKVTFDDKHPERPVIAVDM